MKFFPLAILLVLGCAQFTLTAAQEQKRCKALILQCGGDLGAYEVGVLKGMYEALPEGSLEYDVISGNSFSLTFKKVISFT